MLELLSPPLRVQSIVGQRLPRHPFHRSSIATAGFVFVGRHLRRHVRYCAESLATRFDQPECRRGRRVRSHRRFHAHAHREHWAAIAVSRKNIGRVSPVVCRGDIDGLARRPGAVTGSYAEMLFTLQSDEAGFLGRWTSWESRPAVASRSWFPRRTFARRSESVRPALDLDAIAYDDLGRLLFSLQANLAATVLGDLDDGDIIRIELDGSATRLFTEAGRADGGGVGKPARVRRSGTCSDSSSSRERCGRPFQSPSANDGSVFSLGSVPGPRFTTNHRSRWAARSSTL